MVKSAARKVMWVGRATTFLVGLAVVLALSVGLASSALAGTGVGARFDLGKTNTVNAITKLVGSVAGSSLLIDNNSADAAATALDLQVEPGKAPMTVNSSTKVANLNADRVDGRDNLMSASTYEVSKAFTGTANTHFLTVLACDAEDKALSGGYFLGSGRNSNVTIERTFGNTYQFEVLSGASPETGTIFALCADQDGDGAGTAAASAVESPESALKKARAARE